MNTKQETILVTGATGTVGGEVVKQLSRDTPNHKIKAGFHSLDNIKKEQGKRIEFVHMDFNKPETMREALEGVNKLFLLNRDSPNMVELASKAIKLAKDSGVGIIVRLSAKGADFKAESLSLRMHRQVEKIIEESGIPFTFLRPNEFMQNFINFHAMSIKGNNSFHMAVEDSKVSIVDVRDIAAVAVKALTNGRNNDRFNDRVYTITGPEALSYYQIAGILSEVTGRKISYQNLSKEDFGSSLREAGVDEWFINIVLQILDSYYKTGIAAQVTQDIEEITGEKPIPFYQFARDYVQSFS